MRNKQVVFNPYICFIKIVPFWVWNIRFNTHQAVFRTATGAAASYVATTLSWKNGCQLCLMFIVAENRGRVNTAKHCSKEEVSRITYVSYSCITAFGFRNYDTCINDEFDIYAKMQVFLWFSILITLHTYIIRVKGKDLTQSYDKNHYTRRKVQKATWQHKNATKTSTTQRLRTDLGRSVGITIVTQLVLLREKERDLTQSYDKCLYTDRKI